MIWRQWLWDLFEMRDVLGWRRKFGVIGPSTNTVVQPDFEMMRRPASPTTIAASSRRKRKPSATSRSWRGST